MAEAAKKQSPVVMPDRMVLAEHKRQDWVVDLPVGVTLEMAMEPGYWAHVAAQMEPLDHVELRADDGSWVAFLIVRYCERSYAIVHLVSRVDLAGPTDAPSSTQKHRVEWKGGAMKHCVIRNADGAVLHQGERDKQAAVNWMIEHEKSMR